ncbi:hypothetical protein GobsT_47600 [Gemmata obscuriglobus]|uniref:YHYH domain-containing protein n=1 Tax=Gemmata obscuriglobus TaxID=114 RepID=A0A2Z3GZ04_9BACT|nr:hypothetical protein [Gemmata obscuriglobus]AWM37292.1 hypothetical protein C1280_09805 [Gemmata obscuriglobus]QEG29961.1 hypothetical protein GobsT_47600 [Gemmata obscuriglobus]VTS09280.1 unnamed protein product [Gemmata obscuriglobus UQM 2246]
MVRLFVNLVLIPCLLLTQFAAVPHAHAGGSTGTSHEGHPHFHFHLFGSDPATDGLRACFDAECADTASARSAPPWDHDADAVYVESTTASPEREKHLAPEFIAELAPALVPLLRDTDAPVAPRLDDRIHLPVRCPLYVRFLALTI